MRSSFEREHRPDPAARAAAHLAATTMRDQGHAVEVGRALAAVSPALLPGWLEWAAAANPPAKRRQHLALWASFRPPTNADTAARLPRDGSGNMVVSVDSAAASGEDAGVLCFLSADGDGSRARVPSIPLDGAPGDGAFVAAEVRADDLLQLHALHAAAAAGGGAGGGWLRVTAVDLPSKRVLAVDDRAAALGASVAVRKIGVGSLPGALVARRSDEGALVGYQLPMLDAAWGLAELQRHADASGAEREAGTQLASTQVRAALKREQWLVASWQSRKHLIAAARDALHKLSRRRAADGNAWIQVGRALASVDYTLLRAFRDWTAAEGGAAADGAGERCAAAWRRFRPFTDADATHDVAERAAATGGPSTADAIRLIHPDGTPVPVPALEVERAADRLTDVMDEFADPTLSGLARDTNASIAVDDRLCVAGERRWCDVRAVHRSVPDVLVEWPGHGGRTRLPLCRLWGAWVWRPSGTARGGTELLFQLPESDAQWGAETLQTMAAADETAKEIELRDARKTADYDYTKGRPAPKDPPPAVALVKAFPEKLVVGWAPAGDHATVELLWCKPADKENRNTKDEATAAWKPSGDGPAPAAAAASDGKRSYRWKVLYTGNHNGCEVAGLVPCTAYSVRVRVGGSKTAVARFATLPPPLPAPRVAAWFPVGKRWFQRTAEVRFDYPGEKGKGKHGRKIPKDSFWLCQMCELERGLADGDDAPPSRRGFGEAIDKARPPERDAAEAAEEDAAAAGAPREGNVTTRPAEVAPNVGERKSARDRAAEALKDEHGDAWAELPVEERGALLEAKMAEVQAEDEQAGGEGGGGDGAADEDLGEGGDDARMAYAAWRPVYRGRLGKCLVPGMVAGRRYAFRCAVESPDGVTGEWSVPAAALAPERVKAGGAREEAAAEERRPMPEPEPAPAAAQSMAEGFDSFVSELEWMIGGSGGDEAGAADNDGGGWLEHADESGRPYFEEVATGRVQWTRPE